MMDLQVTGGSSAVRGTGHLGMRVAGAAAKVMLVEAAAKQWNVPAAECSAKLSKVTHAGSGRTLTYGELAPQAALLTPPVHPPLKSRDDYTIVGKPTPRIDIPSKVNGSATYGVDVTLPQMLYATIAASPVFGAKLVSVDTCAGGSAARREESREARQRGRRRGRRLLACAEGRARARAEVRRYGQRC